MNEVVVAHKSDPAAIRSSMLLMIAFVSMWAIVEVIAAPLFTRISGFQVVWARYGVHLTLMLLIWGWRDPGVLWRTQRPWFQIGRSLLMLGMPASWILGTQRGVSPGALMAIFWLAPLGVLALAHCWLRERVHARYWMAGIVGYVGACLASMPAFPTMLSEWVFPAGMAGTFGLYVVMTRALRHETLQANLFYTALGVFVSLSFVMPSMWVTPSVNEAFALVAIGLLGWVALLALDRSAAAAPLSASTSYLYVQAPITVALIMFVSQTHPVTSAIVGVALVVCVVIYLWVRAPSALGVAT